MSNCLTIHLGAPFLPEGASIRYDAPYNDLTPEDTTAIDKAIIYIREEAASRSELDEVIAKLLVLEDTLDGKMTVLERVLTAVAALLPPEEKLAYANEHNA